MAASAKARHGYHPPFVWNMNGQQSLFPVAVAATLDVTKLLDGTREAPCGLIIDLCRLHLVQAGTGATDVTYELYRRRAAANTLIITLSVTSDGSTYAINTGTGIPASTALRTVNAGDKFYVQPTVVVADAYDATIEIQFR